MSVIRVSSRRPHERHYQWADEKIERIDGERRERENERAVMRAIRTV